MFNRPTLENILKIYQVKAQSNPETLRSLIPAKEMWRFYIDGRLQKKTRKLEDCIDAFCGYGEDKTRVHSMTICEFAKNYDDSFQQKRDAPEVSVEDIKSSCFYADMKDYAFSNVLDYFISHDLQNSVTIADLLALDKAWLAFEAHESGYLSAVQNAAHYARICDDKFTVQDVLEIHKRCGSRVTGTNYADLTFESIGEFRKSIWAGYDVSDHTSSVAGIFQLLKNMKPHQHFLVTFVGTDPEIQGIFHLNAETLKGICNQATGTLGFGQLTGMSMRHCYEHECKNPIADAFNQFRQQIYEIFIGGMDDTSLMRLARFLQEHMSDVHKIAMMLGPDEDNEVMADIGYRSIVLDDNMPADKMDISKFYDEIPGVRDRLALIMNQFLNELYDNLERQQQPAARLKSIIKFIQDCEQLHPFADLNCRTFCMVMLQELLQRNGFPPTILDDPNCFDLLSIDEIFDMVVEGMQRVFRLTESHRLYGVNTDEVLKQLQSRPLLSYFSNQFDDFVRAEEYFRLQSASDQPRLGN